jgi:hypothetical protein
MKKGDSASRMRRTMERVRHEGLDRFGLLADKNPTSCVHWCIMIVWVETPSTPPFIG